MYSNYSISKKKKINRNIQYCANVPSNIMNLNVSMLNKKILQRAVNNNKGNKANIWYDDPLLKK